MWNRKKSLGLGVDFISAAASQDRPQPLSSPPTSSSSSSRVPFGSAPIDFIFIVQPSLTRLCRPTLSPRFDPVPVAALAARQRSGSTDPSISSSSSSKPLPRLNQRTDDHPDPLSRTGRSVASVSKRQPPWQVSSIAVECLVISGTRLLTLDVLRPAYLLSYPGSTGLKSAA